LTLGLTGGYCAGKSSVAAILHEDGWKILSVDAFGHEALRLSLPAVLELLGPQAVKADGSPDRRFIGSHVFADPALLERYEAIVHPVMNELTARAVMEGGSKVCVDAALLYRLPIVEACDAVLEVRTPIITRLWRAYRRDGIGPGAALDRIARQSHLWKSAFQYQGITAVIWNSGSKASLEKKIHGALSQIYNKNKTSLA